LNYMCLSCQIPESDMVLSGGYHTRCCRKLFGTTIPPKVPFSTPDVAGEAQKMVGKMSRIANFIKKHSSVPGLDLIRLFERALLFYVLGNGDAHLKNFSLLRKKEVDYQLSPAYDIVNSRLVLPEEKEDMCLSLQGKKNRLSGGDFRRLSKRFGLTKKQVDNSLTRLNELKPNIKTMIAESFLSQRFKDRFLEIFKERLKRIFG